MPQVPTRKLAMPGLKAKPSSQRSKRWLWRVFSSSARKDGLALSHWVRADAEFTDYPFARFNKRVEVVRYTDAEYAELLTPAPGATDYKADEDLRWPKEHTDALFDLCRRFDLRWPIIVDRFPMHLTPQHTVEDMKLRFYTVTTRIIAHRIRSKDEVVKSSVSGVRMYENFAYKAEAELKRRKILDAIFRRSNESLAHVRDYLRELRAVQAAVKKLASKPRRPGAPLPTLGGVSGAGGGGSGGAMSPLTATALAVTATKGKGGRVAAGAVASQPPPLFPTAGALTVANLAVKKRGPTFPGAAFQPYSAAGVTSDGGAVPPPPINPATGLPLDYDAIAAFTGVALRSSQIAAPLEGTTLPSKTHERVKRFMREQLGLADRPMAAVQVFAVHRQLRREVEYMLTLARAVEAEEETLHKLIAQRREAGLRPLAVSKPTMSSAQLARQPPPPPPAPVAAVPPGGGAPGPGAPGALAGIPHTAAPGAPRPGTMAAPPGQPAGGAGVRGPGGVGGGPPGMGSAAPGAAGGVMRQGVPTGGPGGTAAGGGPRPGANPAASAGVGVGMKRGRPGEDGGGPAAAQGQPAIKRERVG